MSAAAAESTDQVGDMYYYPSSESTVAWNYGETIRVCVHMCISASRAGAYFHRSRASIADNVVRAGANFAGATKTDGTWTSGADSVTAATVAENLTSYDLSGKAGSSGGPPAWAVGMFGKYMIADPSYSGANGGFGGNTDYYPLNGNDTIPMCGGKVCLHFAYDMIGQHVHYCLDFRPIGCNVQGYLLLTCDSFALKDTSAGCLG